MRVAYWALSALVGAVLVAPDLLAQRASAATLLLEVGGTDALARELRIEPGVRSAEYVRALADTVRLIAIDSSRPNHQRESAVDALALAARERGTGVQSRLSLDALRSVAHDASGPIAGLATAHLARILPEAEAVETLTELARRDRPEAVYAVLQLADHTGAAGYARLASLVRQQAIVNELARSSAERIVESRPGERVTKRP